MFIWSGPLCGTMDGGGRGGDNVLFLWPHEGNSKSSLAKKEKCPKTRKFYACGTQYFYIKETRLDPVRSSTHNHYQEKPL